MNELALYAGVGGGLLATKWMLGWRTICYVEWEQYCINVLKQRITDGYLDDAPIWDDARTFDGQPWRGCVDIVTAGFPCQPFSVAGRRKGKDDKRNMWPDTIRIIREVQPQWVLLENVPGLRCCRRKKGDTPTQEASYFGTVLSDLAQSGYDARWKVLSAAEVGAPHKRDRIWIIARRPELVMDDARSNRYLFKDEQAKEKSITHRDKVRISEQTSADVAHSHNTRLEGRNSRELQECASECSAGEGSTQMAHTKYDGLSEAKEQRQTERVEQQARRTEESTSSKQSARSHSRSTVPRTIWETDNQWWLTEPNVGRVANGVASRVDRLKAIGNGQVPAVVAVAWRLLSEGLNGETGSTSWFEVQGNITTERESS